ncbi:hypothetical protein INT43_002526 [Umbelopsis isabellina]|uniref:Uncharacterized protein n=1 Tax=Mortierella isabellina TaxID=91625 RepID=A0A8H7Q6C5_MORIS|nr:hypothetical protein INT43_002526 [Umbelopsis isabellina]
MLGRSLYKVTSPRLYSASGQRFYATSRKPSFWYSYGTPLFNLLLWSSTTTLAFHLLWHKLDYAEFKKAREDEIKDLEHRIKAIQDSKQV